MDRRYSKKSQGRIKINLEASEKLNELFSQESSQESNTSLVFSATESTPNEKGETTDHSTSSASTTNETKFTNTCSGVISLPKIVIAPRPPLYDNAAEKKDATGSGAGKNSPPPIKLPLLSTTRQVIRQQRVRSSVRRTPLTSNPEKPSEKRSSPPVKPPPPTKGQPRQPERIRSASLRKKSPFVRNRPSPIGKDRDEDEKPKATGNNTQGICQEPLPTIEEEAKAPCPSPIASIINDDPHYSDDFDEEDDKDKDDSSDNDTSDSDDSDKRQTNNRPVSGVTRRVGGTFNGKVFPPCVIPQYQRRSSFPLFVGQAVISPLVKTYSMPSLTETSTIEKQIPVAVSAGLPPKVIGLRKKKKEISSSQLIQKMASHYSLTPLKMIANDLITLHYDVYPTEIFPGLNRSPSFIGVKDKNNGLMSGRSTPKLDIPRRRYCGRMIHQHPLVKFCYRMNDRRLAHLIKKQVSSSSSSSSSYGYDYGDVTDDNNELQKEPIVDESAGGGVQKKEDAPSTKEQENIKTIPKETSYLEMFTKKLGRSKPVKKPLPFMKPSGYLEIYKKKVSFSKKKVLPPIGCKPPEDKQPALVLMPTPPSQSSPSSGQAAAMRSARKVRMEHQQQKNKIPGIGKKQKQC